MIGLHRSLLLATAAALVVVASSAKAEDFSQRKALHVHAEQQELVILAESLGCIAVAVDEMALKACLDRKHQQLEASHAQYSFHP